MKQLLDDAFGLIKSYKNVYLITALIFVMGIILGMLGLIYGPFPMNMLINDILGAGSGGFWETLGDSVKIALLMLIFGVIVFIPLLMTLFQGTILGMTILLLPGWTDGWTAGVYIVLTGILFYPAIIFAGGNGALIGLKVIRQLKEKIGIPNLIAVLSALPEIAYVRITPVKQDSAAHRLEPVVRFFRDDKQQLAEAHLFIDGHQLEVGVTATVFFQRLDQLWRQFFLFAALIAVFGGVLSWVWYRYQMEYVRRIQDYERHLAGEKEDAALGRASATITHEIRNPLNAISMGLQRLKMEGTELSGEHQHLVGSLLNAVKRTNDIISDLKRYAGPILPRVRKFDFTALVSDLVTLYKSNCREKGIGLTFASSGAEDIEGDADLIAVVVENLIKNAVEAQPRGGEIEVRIIEEHDIVRLSIENSGLDIAPDQLEQLFEPYFTTKTRGSGLGLAIVKRIVNAHNGRISLISPSPGRLRISVFFPKAGGRTAVD